AMTAEPNTARSSHPPTATGEPVRDDTVTIGARCAYCGGSFRPHGRARFCSQACRQRAYRRRHQHDELAAAAHLTATSVYECPACSLWLLGEQRCPDCNLFCRSLGPGSLCPHCDEPTLLAELLTTITHTSDR